MNLMVGFMLILLSEGGESGGSPLDVNPGLIIWTVITFISLLLILSKFAWKPILNSLRERELFITDSLAQADAAQKEAEKLISDNKANYMRAEEEAQKIIDQGREYAEKLKAQILDESKQNAKKMIESAANEIERKNAEAFNKLKSQVAEIAIDAAEKILKANLDKEKNINLINSYLDDLSKN
jgi:F-type H+-transporting ATPase subunit b